MGSRLAPVLFLLGLAACGDPPDHISVRVFPAVLAADADREEAAGWDSVFFEGSSRCPAGAYLVAPEPLFTEWNILAFRAAGQPDGRVAVVARLNEYAARKMRKFCADSTRLKRPLGVCIDGRWADFTPLLGWTGNRITLYGFTREETDRLQRYLDHK